MTSALLYVRSGLALVEIPNGKKRPIKTGWNLEGNAITSAPDAGDLTGNIGLAHAYSTPPTMALDIDDLPKARVWFAERDIDLDALLAADNGVQVSSGREGRAKLLYRLPGGVDPIPTKQIVDPEVGDMVLEFRCATASGLTVQDVLPPSIHPETGKPYRWAGKGNWREIPELPAQLLSVWRTQLKPAPGQSRPSGAVVHDSAVAELSPQTIQHLRSALLSMRSDDHALWIKVGMALKSLGDVGRGLWLEWSLTSEKSQYD